MEPDLFTPFIQSARHVFATMLQVEVDVLEPRPKSGRHEPHAVSAMIELKGGCEGSMVLGFEQDAAERLVALMTGTHTPSHSAECADALGELASIVACGAKALLSEGFTSASLPRVVLDAEPMADRTMPPAVVLPCVTDCGRFVIEVSILGHGPSPVSARRAETLGDCR